MTRTLAGNIYIRKKNDSLFIDDISIEEFLNRANTPMMIFLENKLRDNIKSFNNVFNAVFPNFESFYSFKANYLPEICKIINSEGVGAEVIGLPELNLALKIGFPSNKILVGGPYLPAALIQKSVDNEVREIIVYNLNDLEKIDNYAKNKGIVQNICIRVNSTKYNSRLGIVFNDDNLNKLDEIFKQCKNINISTILSHFSTQMNDLEQFKHNVESVIKNHAKLSEHGHNIKKLNLGGGFPEATVMNQVQLEKIARGMMEVLNKANISFDHVYLEPGRYFVGDVGLFLAEIVQVADSRWAFLNIGNHICPKFAKCALRFYNVSKIEQPHKYKTSFAGIVPTDQDVLAKNYYFTKSLNEGDLVLVSNVGAYCLTFSNRFPYPLPDIFLVKKNEIKQIHILDICNDLAIK